jgi:hypothetical protein
MFIPARPVLSEVEHDAAVHDVAVHGYDGLEVET